MHCCRRPSAKETPLRHFENGNSSPYAFVCVVSSVVVSQVFQTSRRGNNSTGTSSAVNVEALRPEQLDEEEERASAPHTVSVTIVMKREGGSKELIRVVEII
jgi:hypothetical protein